MKPKLFDHLVSKGEQLRRDIEAERLGGPQINHKFEVGRLHDWEVCRLSTVENLPGVDTDSTVRFGDAGSVASQTAGRGKATQLVDRGNGMACSERDELRLLTVEKRVRAD